MHEERTELSLRHVSSEILTTARMLPSRTNSPSAEVPQERIILESNRECGKGVMRTIFCNKTGLKLTRTNSKFYTCGTSADGLLVLEGSIRAVVSISELTCRNDNSVLSSCMTYHRVCNKSNTMGVTSEAETATLP
jgi:hypothetical protein